MGGNMTKPLSKKTSNLKLMIPVDWSWSQSIYISPIGFFHWVSLFIELLVDFCLVLLKKYIGTAQEMSLRIVCPYLLTERWALARSISAECHKLSLSFLSSWSVITLFFGLNNQFCIVNIQKLGYLGKHVDWRLEVFVHHLLTVTEPFTTVLPTTYSYVYVQSIPWSTQAFVVHRNRYIITRNKYSNKMNYSLYLLKKYVLIK